MTLAADGGEGPIWSGELLREVEGGLILGPGVARWGPRPAAGQWVDLRTTEEVLPLRTSGSVVGASSAGIAVALAHPWTAGAPGRRALSLCMPHRSRPVPEADSERLGLGVLGRDAARDASASTPRRGGDSDAARLEQQFGRLDARLEALVDLLTWPGIADRPWVEEEVILTRDSICLTPNRLDDPRPGELIEVEMLLPTSPVTRRIRYAARLVWVVDEPRRLALAVYTHIDGASRDALEQYLFAVERKHAREAALTQSRVPRPTPAAAPRRPAPPRPAPASVPTAPPPAAPRREAASEPDTADDRISLAFEALRGLYDVEETRDGLVLALDVVHALVSSTATVAFELKEEGRADRISSRGRRQRRLLEGRHLPLRGSLLGRCLAEGVPIASSRVDDDRRLEADIDCWLGAESERCLCVPIVGDGRSRGALLLVDDRLDARWSEETIAVAAYVGKTVGRHLDVLGALSLDAPLETLDFTGDDPTIPHDGLATERSAGTG